MSFSDLGLAEPLVRALEAKGYETPTPIQRDAIPTVLTGRDLLGIAQTGTGKTAAFVLPSIQRLVGSEKRVLPTHVRMLVLAPTRELASQIADNAKLYARHSRLSVATVFGGTSINKNRQDLSRGVDILVATPGRLLDHIDGKMLRLDQVEHFVLDEADQMLDLGFIHAIRRILPMLPHRRQTLFFSATMPKAIKELADAMLRDPATVAVTPVAKTADRVEQSVIFVEQSGKRAVLAELLSTPDLGRALVFTRTKHGADKVVRQLSEAGIDAAAIHGNKSQAQRERALGSFRTGHLRVLVATDIAARGIDVDGVTHVVNHDVPNVPESYVHRIGRTARAGAEGVAISLVANDERAYLRDIERLIRQSIPATDRRSEAGKAEPEGDGAASQKTQRQGRPQGQRPGGGGRPQQGRGGRGGAPGGGEQRRGHGGAEAQGRHRPDGRRADGSRSDGEMSGMPFMQKPGRPAGQRPRGGRPEGRRSADRS